MSKIRKPPPGTAGLALAEHYFGPLQSPIAATPAEWTAYTEHRRRTNARYKNVFTRRKRRISDTVAIIESELDLDVGTLQKCVSVLWRIVEWDDSNVRDAEVSARIYSVAAPKYVDVHIKYHWRPGSYYVEWDYSLGYKVHHHISESPTAYCNPSTEDDPSTWHSRESWQSICWGYYDDDEAEDELDWDAFDYERLPDWRRIERGEVGLNQEAVSNIHETLFGPIDMPPRDDVDAISAYRRKLVGTVRLLFAAVGIDYQVACVDEEMDGGFEGFMLEGLSDLWVARGVRAACGFQLSGDAEAARLGEEERREEATRRRYDDEDEDEDEDAHYAGLSTTVLLTTHLTR